MLDNHPSYVVRIPNSEEGNNKCRNEYRILNYLDGIKISGISYSKAVALFNIDDKNYYVQKIIRFKLMLSGISLVRKKPPRKFFKIATKALIDIYNVTHNTDKKVYSDCYKCFQHGDFWVGNIGLWNKKVVLLDLEFSEQAGMPLFDLLHFGLYYKVVSANIGMVSNISAKRISDNRIFEPDYETVLELMTAKDSLSTLMRESILTYLKDCSIPIEAGLELIKDYFEKDRKIKGLPEQWEQSIFN